MGLGSTSVIQVTNIAPTVTNEQLRNLFSFIGTIREFIVYPLDQSQQICRVGYVKFLDSMCVPVAQHLTNTVFIDRAILVKPVADGKIPDESLALKLANEGHSQNSSNSGVVSQVATVNGVQSITTIDPRLNALGLPQYPPLPANLDPSKIEEIRRTITVSNIAKLSSPEDLLEFFNQFGEVKYLRMTSSETDIIKSALIEFTDQSSVANALQNSGINLHGNQLNILHATTNILKPQYKNEGEKPPEPRDSKRRSRSRSKSHRRSRSPARKTRRSRSPRRSKERRRSPSGSRSPPRRRRSRSPRRRSVERKRSRSYSKESRSRDRSRRDRSRDRYHRDSVERRRSYERDRDKDRRRGERTKDRRSRDRSKERDRKRRDRDRSRERESDRRDRHRSRKDKDRHRSKSRSISKSRSTAERRDKEIETPVKDKDLIDNGDTDRALEAESSSVKSGHSSSQKSASPQAFSPQALEN